MRTRSTTVSLDPLNKRYLLKGKLMKKVILAVMLTALALFLILPNLSWGI